MTVASEDSGCMDSRRASCLKASLRTSLGSPAFSMAFLSSSNSSDSPPSSPSSFLMAFICSRRKKSRWALSMPSRAMFWIFCCMEATSTSFMSWPLTISSRLRGSMHSRIFWASSTFMRRLEAMRSASRPGSVTLLSTPMMSTEEMPRRERIFSLCSREARMRASCSGRSSLTSCSGRDSTSARW